MLIGLPRLQIRDELKQKGVTLDDRTRVWQSIDGRRGMIGGGAMAGGMGGGSMVRKPQSASGTTFCCSWLTSTHVCFARCFASRARRVCSRIPRPGSIRSRSGSVLAAALGPPAARVCSALHPQPFDQDMQTAAVTEHATRP